eukprot:283290-Rhodomonas_salina.1
MCSTAVVVPEFGRIAANYSSSRTTTTTTRVLQVPGFPGMHRGPFVPLDLLASTPRDSTMAVPTDVRSQTCQRRSSIFEIPTGASGNSYRLLGSVGKYL